MNSSHPTKTRYRTDPVMEDLGEFRLLLKSEVRVDEMTAVMKEKKPKRPNMTGCPTRMLAEESTIVG